MTDRMTSSRFRKQTTQDTWVHPPFLNAHNPFPSRLDHIWEEPQVQRPGALLNCLYQPPDSSVAPVRSKVSKNMSSTPWNAQPCTFSTTVAAVIVVCSS
jgi:hypothetical protein